MRRTGTPDTTPETEAALGESAATVGRRCALAMASIYRELKAMGSEGESGASANSREHRAMPPRNDYTRVLQPGALQTKNEG